MRLSVIVITAAFIWSILPHWFKQACIGIKHLLTMLYKVKMHSRNYSGRYWNFADVFEERVDMNPSLEQIVCVDDGTSVTIGELDAMSNQIAHWALDQGFQKGDTIAVMIQNRPEMVASWLAMGKICVASALINTNSQGKALTHAVELATKDSSKKILIADGDLRAQIKADIPTLSASGITVLFLDDLQPVFKKQSSKRPDKSIRASSLERDAFLYIYTSGTTGLPKASKISHSRFFIGTLPFSTMCSLQPGSRVYNCLPLYHSAGGMLGMGACLAHGATVCLRRKFSVKAWSSDCVKYKCNACQYIGELARYLINAPPNELDKQVQLEYALGNGMRPEVWVKFQSRYNVKHVVEFYAATEGNIGLFNSCDKVGALGFVPRVVDFLYPVKLVKPDPERKDVPLRDPVTGFCVPCGVDEVGLMIGEFDNARVDRRFDGYTDKAATDKKVIKDAFRKGDSYFNTGDLLTRDYWGFFFWSDRTGDTFRWKGENVSTAEVGGVISAVPGISDVAVYGVEIPGCDGKAGMAAITIDNDSDSGNSDNEEQQLQELWKRLHAELTAHLPAYARPIFIRVQKHMALTSTFKHQKSDLVAEGYDLQKCKGDSIYFYTTKDGKFQLLDQNLSAALANKTIQL